MPAGSTDIARGVIAVIGSDDVPLDRLAGGLRDRVEQLLRLRRIALAIRQQHAVAADDEHADGRHARLLGWKSS